MTSYTYCLRFVAALAVPLVLVVGVLPGCIDPAPSPPIFAYDAGVDTCTVKGGRCAGRGFFDVHGGPCDWTENEDHIQLCPTQFMQLTDVVCCTPKPACEGIGRGTCDYEGGCDGESVFTRLCANGKTCCVPRTPVDWGGVKPERDAAVEASDDASLDASLDASSGDGSD